VSAGSKGLRVFPRRIYVGVDHYDNGEVHLVVDDLDDFQEQGERIAVYELVEAGHVQIDRRVVAPAKKTRG
jgi:hypothetical protein